VRRMDTICYSRWKASISSRIQLPANFDNRVVVELERNALIFSCVVCLNGN
jgi:hypothetical protein